MKPIKQLNSLPRSQNGATLFVALILLVLISLIGIGTLKSAVIAEKMSSSDYQKIVTFQAAENAVSTARLTDTNFDDPILNQTILELKDVETNTANTTADVSYTYAGKGLISGWDPTLLVGHRITITSVVSSNDGGTQTTTIHGVTVPGAP